MISNLRGEERPPRNEGQSNHDSDNVFERLSMESRNLYNHVLISSNPALLLSIYLHSQPHCVCRGQTGPIKGSHPIQRQSCTHAVTPSSTRVHQDQPVVKEKHGQKSVVKKGLNAMHWALSGNQRIAHFLFFAFLTLTPLLFGFDS